MKEIRLHGIGGLGTVKAGELLVHASVADGKYGNSIPFFGFERQGAPVTSYVRLDKKEIRPKNQVYNPDCIIVLDPTVMNAVDVFDGLKDNSVLVLNTSVDDISELDLPDVIGKVAFLDASDIASKVLKNQITNTIMLAAFAKATGWVNIDILEEKVEKMFGEKNKIAFREGINKVKVKEIK